MGRDLLIWRYVFVPFEKNFQGAYKRRFFPLFFSFFPREGKRNAKARQRQREKGLVGIYPLDCTTSTEWATKIHTGREKGNQESEMAKELMHEWARRENNDIKIRGLYFMFYSR